MKGGPGIDGCTFRILTVINGFIRTCLAIVVARRLNCDDALECWTELFARHAPPDHIRADNGTDNGTEFTAKAIRARLGRVGVKTLYIEPGGLWEKRYSESLSRKLGDEPLNGEIFHTLKEAGVLIERWRQQYNTVTPHSSLGSRPTAPRRSCSTLPPRPTLNSGRPGRAQIGARILS